MMPLIIGVDPGGTTGIFALWLASDPLMVRNPVTETYATQCSGPPELTSIIVRCFRDIAYSSDTSIEVTLAVESFVVSSRAARSRHSGAGKQARDIIAHLERINNIWISSNSASAVKKWATDDRLDKAGIIKATVGMRHARDASRHALFVAVRDGLMPDPLSHKQTPAL